MGRAVDRLQEMLDRHPRRFDTAHRATAEAVLEINREMEIVARRFQQLNDEQGTRVHGFSEHFAAMSEHEKDPG